MRQRKIEKEAKQAFEKANQKKLDSSFQKFSEGKDWEAKAEECRQVAKEEKGSKKKPWLKPLLITACSLAVIATVTIPTVLHFRTEHYGQGNTLTQIKEGTYTLDYQDGAYPLVFDDDASVTYSLSEKRELGCIVFNQDEIGYSGYLSFDNSTLTDISLEKATIKPNNNQFFSSFAYLGNDYSIEISYESGDGLILFSITDSSYVCNALVGFKK